MRLALALTDSGERWVTGIADTGRIPRTITRYGIVYRVLMTMSVEHIDVADRWWQAVKRQDGSGDEKSVARNGSVVAHDAPLGTTGPATSAVRQNTR
jgi:hypothetical protein